MTTLDEALATTTPEPVTATSTATPRRCRHRWVRIEWSSRLIFTGPGLYCDRCDAKHDEQKARRGKSSRRLGGDTERRLERVYGARKVGQFGDAIDLVGRVWKWQSKATRDAPSRWLRAVDAPVGATPPKLVTDAEAAMRQLRPDLRPLVIQSFVKHGVPTIDRIWVRHEDWAAEHGGWRLDGWEWLVMDGGYFLDVNGRDEP